MSVETNATGITTDALPSPADFPVGPDRQNASFDPLLLQNLKFHNGILVNSDAFNTQVEHHDVRSTGMEMEDFMKYLPSHLVDDSEILILNAEEDGCNAKLLKEYIEENVKFCDGKLIPKVVLLDDVIAPKGTEALDYAFPKTLYLFIYCTKEFCDNSLHLLQSHSCLKRALGSKEDNWSIIPVHTCSKSNRDYTLPLMLDGLRPINYFNMKTFAGEVTRLLEHKRHLVLERRTAAKDRIDAYVKEMQTTIEKQMKYLNTDAENTTCQSKFEEFHRSFLRGSVTSFNNNSNNNNIQDAVSSRIHQKQAQEVDSRALQPMPDQTQEKQFLCSEEQPMQHTSSGSRTPRENRFSSITFDGAYGADDPDTSSTGSNTSLMGQQLNRHCKSGFSEGISNDGDNPEINASLKTVDVNKYIEQNRGSQNFSSISENIFRNQVQLLQMENQARSRNINIDIPQTDSTPTASSTTYHFHFDSATNVVIGDHGVIKVVPLGDRRKISDDVCDSDHESI